MRGSLTTIFGAVLIATLVGIPHAKADETGLANIHTWQKIAGRTCFTDHEHDGSGNGATPQLAMSAAIKSWEAFTDLEYGSDWASYANTVGKRASCTRYGNDISCQISARPCRGGAMAPLKRKASRR